MNNKIKEKEIEQAFSNSPIGISFVSIDGKFLKVNRALCEFLGYSEGELLQLTFQEVTHPTDLQKDLECLDDLYHDEIPYYTIRKRYLGNYDGKILGAKLTVYPIKDLNRKVSMYLAYIQPITIDSLNFFDDVEEIFTEALVSRFSAVMEKKIAQSDTQLLPKFILGNWQWFAGAIFIVASIISGAGVVLYSGQNQLIEMNEEIRSQKERSEKIDNLLLEIARQRNEIPKTDQSRESK